VSLKSISSWFFGDDSGVAKKPLVMVEEGKPKIELPADVEAEIARITNYTRSDLIRAQSEAVIRAIYEIVQTRQIDKANLSSLLRGFESKYKFVWEDAGRRLMQLSHYFPEVRDELFRIINTEIAELRLKLVKAIWKAVPPRSLMLTILRRGLVDEDREVRHFSVDRVRAQNCAELVDDLHALRARETDSKSARFIDFTLALMNDGFFVEEQAESGDYMLTVALGVGGTASQTIPKEDYGPTAVQATLTELRAKWEKISGERDS
jgi:hypothetical protein